MKSQMQVLKNHLSDSEIVSREMLDATIKSSAKNLISKRLWNIVAIVTVLLMAGFIAYVCLSLHKCSVLFMAATIVWCVFLALVNFRQYKDSTVAIDSYVCEYIHTWNANSLVIRLMVFQVRMVYRTGKNGLQLFFG